MGILGHIVASGQHVCMMSDTCVAKEQLSPVGHTAAKMSTAPANQLFFFFVVLGFMNRIFFRARLHGHFGRVVKASAC